MFVSMWLWWLWGIRTFGTLQFPKSLQAKPPTAHIRMPRASKTRTAALVASRIFEYVGFPPLVAIPYPPPVLGDRYEGDRYELNEVRCHMV